MWCPPSGGRLWNTTCREHGMRTAKPEHLKTFDYLGLRQNVLTFCAHNRARHFVTHDSIPLVRKSIVLQARRALQFLRTATCRTIFIC